MKQLELLKKVRRVEAPPFLLTRIRAKINRAGAEHLPVSWRWAGALAFGLLIFVNVSVLGLEKNQASAPVEQLALGLQIHVSNQLYDE